MVNVIPRVATKALPAPLMGTIAAISLCGIAPIIIIGATPEGGYAAWVGALLIVMLAGLRFAWILTTVDRRLFEMVFWLFVYVFLGIAPMVQLRVRVDPNTTQHLQHEFDWPAVIVVLVGCFSFLAGNLISRHNLKDVAHSSRVISRGRTSALAVIAIGAGLFYVSRVGIGNLLASRDRLALVRSSIWPDSTTNATITAAVAMLLLVAVVAQARVLAERKALGEKKPLAMLVISIVLLFVCVNPLSSPRYVFGTVLLGVLAAFGLYGTVKKFRRLAIASILALVFLFPLADVFRESLSNSVQVINPLDALVNGDFDAFAQINNTMFYVERFGSTWGWQAVGVLFFWVPRVMWPNKPVDTGILLADSRQYWFTNLSAPMWSELYINGGWLLLVIGMGAFGFALCRWDARTERDLGLTGFPTILGSIVPFYLLIVLRGSLMQSMAYLSVLLLGTLFVTRRPGANPSDSSIRGRPISAVRR